MCRHLAVCRTRSQKQKLQPDRAQGDETAHEVKPHQEEKCVVKGMASLLGTAENSETNVRK